MSIESSSGNFMVKAQWCNCMETSYIETETVAMLLENDGE
jgi:hypothetical protein